MPVQPSQDRSQIQMLCLEDKIPETSYIRVLDAFVECLDLTQLGFKPRVAKTGRPHYDSKALLKLYLYGYRYGIRSSRQLAHQCKINLEVQWLTKCVFPKYRTIADFRKDNKLAFKEVFRQLNLMMKMKGLFDQSELIAVDSAFIRAQNSKKRNFTKKKVEFLIQYFDNQHELYMQALDTADQQEKKEAAEWAEYTADMKTYYEELKSYMQQETVQKHYKKRGIIRILRAQETCQYACTTITRSIADTNALSGG